MLHSFLRAEIIPQYAKGWTLMSYLFKSSGGVRNFPSLFLKCLTFVMPLRYHSLKKIGLSLILTSELYHMPCSESWLSDVILSSKLISDQIRRISFKKLSCVLKILAMSILLRLLVKGRVHSNFFSSRSRKSFHLP